MSEEELNAIRARVNASTPGDWTWVDNCFDDDPPEMEIKHGWGDQGPNLVILGEWKTCPHYCQWPEGVTTSRGKSGEPGHEHRERTSIIGSSGYDANGIHINRADAVFIENARKDIIALLTYIDAKAKP